MRLKKITEADKDQIDVIFHIYETFVKSACALEGKDLSILDHHLNSLVELKAKCKREK
jgi:hypothetical protein